MTIPIPFLLVGFPLVAALVVQRLAVKPRIVAIVGAVLVWGLAWWITAVPDTSFTELPGLLETSTSPIVLPALILAPGLRPLLTFLLFVLGVLFLLTLLIPQLPMFVPGAILLIAPVSLTLMMQSTMLRPPLLLLALGVAAAVTQSRIPGSRSAIILLGVGVVGVVLWLLGETAVLTNTNWFLLAAMMLLLGGFPLHFWIQPAAEKMNGSSLLLVFAWMPLVVMMLVHDYLARLPAIWQDIQFTTLVQWSGVAAALLAGLVVLSSPTISRLIAGLIMLDMGIALLSLSIAGGWQTAVSIHLNRILSLIILSIAWRLLKNNGLTDTITNNAGFALNRRLSAGLFIFSAFSLVGLPLTPGFIGRWALMASLSEIGQVPWWVLVLLLVAIVLAALGVIRLLAVWVKQTEETIQSNSEPRWIQGIVAFLLALSIIVATFPQLITNYAARIIGYF